MSTRDDILRDYVPVNERILAFYEKHPQGSLQSELVELSDNRVVMRAYAYREPADERPGIGYSSLEIPGRTPYTRGSEVENCETSAWGRAIAALGFEVKRGIASQEEVRNKSGEDHREVLTTQLEERAKANRKVETNGDGSLIGTAEIAKDSPDFLPHVGPDGPVLTFKLVSPAGGIKVIAKGGLAEVLSLQKEAVIGQRVSCWGRVRDETFRPKNAKKDVTYQVLDLERIKTPTFTLPAPLAALPDDEPPLEEPPEEVGLFGEEVPA